ncbi:hypothetical protein Syun_013804 [Stephania yunnanensis]|uniref:Uncharacterized protein n=1 Tax=Stephania yunnanensis TaxID=152371 RepID=A0AAP0JIB6_9MAGN
MVFRKNKNKNKKGRFSASLFFFFGPSHLVSGLSDKSGFALCRTRNEEGAPNGGSNLRHR